MRHKLSAFVALLCLAISLSIPAGAVEYDGFSDVDSSASYAEAIRWAASKDISADIPMAVSASMTQ